MAIQFNFTTNPGMDITPVKEDIHKALVGSPAYVNSEIAICDGDDPSSSFCLIVGNDQENPDDNVTINIHLDAIPSTEETTNASVEQTLEVADDECPCGSCESCKIHSSDND